MVLLLLLLTVVECLQQQTKVPLTLLRHLFVYAGALSARTPAARLSRSCLDTCLRQFPLLNSHTRHSNGSSRGLLTCKASSASEVGPKKPKRPAGKQPQQQPEKHDRHQHQQQQHSSEWLMDMDEDSDDEEDNFLVRCRGTEAITMPTLAFDKLVW